jgi:hypothetical protein
MEVRDMPTSQHYMNSDEYFRRRLDLLIFPSFLINVYYALFLFISYRLPLFVGFEGSRLITAISSQAMLLILLPFIGYAGLIRRDVLLRSTRKFNLLILVVCTCLVIMTATLPVFFWGGSLRSIFSPLMLTFYLMAIILTRSGKLKVIFAIAAGLTFTLLATVYNEIGINPNIIWLHFSGTQIYGVLYLGSIWVCIYISLYISWRSESTVFLEVDEN